MGTHIYMLYSINGCCFLLIRPRNVKKITEVNVGVSLQRSDYLRELCLCITLLNTRPFCTICNTFFFVLQFLIRQYVIFV